MLKFAKFMAKPVGRGIRILLGLGLIWWGYTMNSTGGTVLMVVGILPILAGLLNLCLISFLLGVPFKGKDILAAPDNNI